MSPGKMANQRHAAARASSASMPVSGHRLARRHHARRSSGAVKEENEQKSLPASEKKLRDARRKGQVSHSRDLVSGFTLTMMFIYLLLAGPSLVDRLIDLVEEVSYAADGPFGVAGNRIVGLTFNVLLLASLPPVAVVVV